MIKIFETLEKYNTYTNNGQNLESGDLYYVKEDNSTHYLTNNIDGVTTIYDTVENPTGNIEITENGEDIDIAQYATASVNVPIPEGYIVPTGNKSITANGENIDVNDYATATVNVPVPPEYIIPTGNVSLTENGENINIAQYATATVNVITPDKEYTVIGDEITSEQTYSGTFILDKYKMVKKAIVPNGYTSIGNICFLQFYDMTDVVIPNTVTSIGDRAFANCKSLDTLTIPNSVTSVGSDIIEMDLGNYGVKHLNIGSGLSSIAYNTGYSDYKAYGVFGNRASQIMESITVDSNNSTYDSRDNCNALIETATNTLLLGCSNSTIPNSVTNIYDRAFQNCTGLTTITIPNSVTTIGANAFANCKSLTSVTIGTGITTIGNAIFVYDFGGTKPLESVTIQATTPPTLGSDAFYGQSRVVIYVPAESVEAYKAASRWSSYASRIQAIPTT